MPFDVSLESVALLVGIFVVSLVISTGIVVAYVVSIAPDYFISDTRGVVRRIGSPWLRALYVAGRNLLGVLLVVVGVVLSLPGVPGQGLLTIFVGVLMLDVPGKRRLELRIVRRPRILALINRVRARFDRAPLVVEVDVAES